MNSYEDSEDVARVLLSEVPEILLIPFPIEAIGGAKFLEVAIEFFDVKAFKDRGFLA